MSELLPQIGDFLSAFAQGRQGSDVRQQRLTNALMGDIQNMDQGQILGSQQYQKLMTVNPAAAKAIGQPIRELDAQRQAALFKDAYVVDQLLAEGNANGAAALLQERLTHINTLGGDPSDTLEIFDALKTQGPEAARSALRPTILAGRAEQMIPGGIGAKEQAEIEKLQAETAKLGAETEEISVKKPISAPPALLEGLSSATRKKAKAAYEAAGGGKDGIKAMESTIERSNTNAQVAALPDILDATFPDASPDERAALNAVVAAAGSPEAGLKAADKVRAEQRRVKKADSFRERAANLLAGVINHPELGDVLGTVFEGRIDYRLQDEEAQLIEDIKEAKNILTGENLDIMTGVLSESDIKIIASLASGGLSRLRSKERFRKDAKEIYKKLTGVDFDDADTTQTAIGKYQVKVVQ